MKIQPFFILLVLFGLSISINGCSNSEVKSIILLTSNSTSKKCINLSADRMNILRVGVTNPISITACNIPSEDLEVSISEGTISPNGKYKYHVAVRKPGSTVITVSAKGLEPTTFRFKVERIRDPVAKLSKSRGGEMKSGEFRAQAGVSAPLNCYDFDAKCKVYSFDIGRIPKGKTLIEASNVGARYEGEVAKLIAQASAGDVYYFHKIRVRCPGDHAHREVNSMVFKIR